MTQLQLFNEGQGPITYLVKTTLLATLECVVGLDAESEEDAASIVADMIMDGGPQSEYIFPVSDYRFVTTPVVIRMDVEEED